MAKQTFINKIAKARKAYDAAIAGVRKDTLGKHLAEIIPEGFFLTWTQGTPSFNDGEPCRFSVHSPFLVTIHEVEGDYDNPVLSNKKRDLTRLEREDDAGWIYSSYSDHSWCGLTKKQIDDFEKAFREIPKDLMLKVFGDGVEVVIVRAGKVTVNDYCMD